MTSIRCPYCGAANTEVAARDDCSFVCQSCGQAVEPPPAGLPVVPPPPPSNRPDNPCWSDGPPAESADRWSTVAPLGGDDSSSSVSISQNSILPPDPEVAKPEPPLVRPARSPLVWPLVILVVFLATLIGVIFVAQKIRPWIDARRTAAQRATVEYWLPRLEHGSEEARLEAAGAIVALGPPAVVKTLEQISRDAGLGERYLFVPAAANALAAVGPDAAAGLREGLKSPEPRVRAVAAEIALEMGRASHVLRDELIAALDDEDRWVRYNAIDALGSQGGDASPAAKRLIDLAKSLDSSAQRHAIDALAHIGPAARDVLPALETIETDDRDPLIRTRAALAAKQIDVQRLAAKARRKAGQPLKELLQAVLGEDPREAIAAAVKLGAMGIKAEPAAAGLATMLHRVDPARRAAAATALGKIGLGAIDFVPTLETAAGDDDPNVRAAAANALESINGKPK
jgi:HEAT repeat protein